MPRCFYEKCPLIGDCMWCYFCNSVLIGLPCQSDMNGLDLASDWLKLLPNSIVLFI